MANDNSGSAVSIVAIFAIMLILAVAAFLAYQAGLFGGRGDGDKDIDVNFKGTSSLYQPAQYVA